MFRLLFLRHIQESNIDQNVIDITRTTSSHCSLIEHSLKERVEKYFNREKIHSNTETNLNKLQRITDDVKILTKQLQQSIQFNNNCSSSITLGRSISIVSHSRIRSILDERLLGEICYQLERRILTLIFSPTKQFYGYSLRYLPLIIEHESNEQQRTMYKKRFEQIENSLRSVHFQFDYHSNLTFSLINQYGIYFDYQWLNHHAHLLGSRSQIHSLCQSIFSKKIYNEDLQIILYSLEMISNSDGKPVFYW